MSSYALETGFDKYWAIIGFAEKETESDCTWDEGTLTSIVIVWLLIWYTLLIVICSCSSDFERWNITGIKYYAIRFWNIK